MIQQQQRHAVFTKVVEMMMILSLLFLTTTHSLAVDGFVDSDFCRQSLQDADADQNNQMDKEEYVTFAQALSPPGLIDDVTTFDDLPFAFTSTFRTISCLCQNPAFGGDPAATECCTGDNAYIRVPTTQNNDDDAYLYAACYLTQGAAQSILESPAPTVGPTTTPTLSPTTLQPTTVEPTTLQPTTVEPTTLQPTTGVPTPQFTTAAPTVAPTTDIPTTSPTFTAPTTSQQTQVVYEIAVTDPDTAPEAYLSDLNVAMDAVAVDVLQQQTEPRRRRRLQVQVERPTSFEDVTAMACPPDFTENACFNVTSTITLTGLTDDDDSNFIQQYTADLDNAIYSGDLQDELDLLQAPIVVLTGLDSEREIDSGSDSISSGAMAGIAVAGVLVVVAAALYVSRRRSDDDAEDKDYTPYQGRDDSSTGRVRNTAGDDSLLVATGSQLDVASKMATGQDMMAEPAMEHYGGDDASSNAGSSGWSSSAGVSSFNTGEDSLDPAVAAGATLAALGVGSALARQQQRGGPSSSDDVSGISSPSSAATREQLDDLIEAGDWAAVGATAALLAAASDSPSISSRSRASSRASSDVDAVRAAELDRLVDAGDWEGVVLAAAQFQSADTSKSAGSAGGTTSGGSTGTGDSYTGTGTGEASTSLSDSPSKAAKREEVRAEVEALVRRVVPEEIDNIDEMMKQFKGREEELVETLRTMQERAVAQKARAAGHRAAKISAKQTVQRGVVPGGVAAIATAAAGDAPSSPSKSQSPKETRSALELAIESGDWEAVGQAAAMMEEGSVETTSTGELDRIADASLSDSDTGSIQRDRSQLKGVNAERAKQLDALIDVGDWIGVITAANQFSSSDRKSSKMSKEEEEALKEAEAWMKIAQETKADGATDAGASDAAEWAIQRSLSQMKDAEKKKPARKGDEDEV